MLTRRDITIVALTLGVAVGGMALAEDIVQLGPKIMGSTVFDWTKLPVHKTLKGESRRVCQAPTATLDELEIHITTLNVGEQAHPPHQHPDEELLIVKEGTVEALANGQWTRVGPGSLIFQASNQLHAIRNVGDTPATYHVIKWNSPGMLKRNAQAKADARAQSQSQPQPPQP